MKRRALSAIVVVMLALWGAGVPRFAHVMTAHLPQDGGSAGASTVQCCSQCSLSREAAKPVDPVEPQETADAEEHDEKREGGHGAHQCPVCALLATLVTNAPAAPSASLAWEPVVTFIAEARPALVLQVEFNPHAPRGPPFLA